MDEAKVDSTIKQSREPQFMEKIVNLSCAFESLTLAPDVIEIRDKRHKSLMYCHQYFFLVVSMITIATSNINVHAIENVNAQG